MDVVPPIAKMQTVRAMSRLCFAWNAALTAHATAATARQTTASAHRTARTTTHQTARLVHPSPLAFGACLNAHFVHPELSALVQCVTFVK